LKSSSKKSNCTNVTWDGRADCVHCAIRQHVLFADIPEDQLENRLITIDNLTYSPHAVLYQVDEKDDALYTIRRGLVKLVQYLPNGTQRIVRLLKAGDVAGMERTVGDAYHHTAIAMQETSVCKIPLGLMESFGRDHTICHQLALRWQRSVDEADSVITQFSTGSAEARVARLLLHLQDIAGGSGCMVVNREDMGAMLGITTETASRVMADFKRRGLVHELPGQQCQCEGKQLELIAQDL
jgi:CRP/FNR family transcriptional regulator, anaerobic regulatory protein